MDAGGVQRKRGLMQMACSIAECRIRTPDGLLLSVAMDYYTDYVFVWNRLGDCPLD